MIQPPVPFVPQKSDAFDLIYRRLLPELYRTRDRETPGNPDPGTSVHGDYHLARYMDGFARVLYLLRNTLNQRLADSFPKPDGQELGCQGWVLPYFADLLDLKLYSPLVDGQRDEVASAISWRKRKGTLGALKEIADSVAQLESEVQEGWRRIAVTPRIGAPIVSASTLVNVPAIPLDPNGKMYPPQSAIRHPGLPAATIDFRYPSRAAIPGKPIPLPPNSPSWARADQGWVQINPHGMPCFPSASQSLYPHTYEDASLRTVDLRPPAWNRGLYHPRRVIVYLAPGQGFFQTSTRSSANWATAVTAGLVSATTDSSTQAASQFKSLVTAVDEGTTVTEQVTVVGDWPPLAAGAANQLSHLNLPVTPMPTPFDSGTGGTGCLNLDQCAVASIQINCKVSGHQVLKATGCLIGSIDVGLGQIELVGCTVLGTVACGQISASDCIFVGNLSFSAPTASGEALPAWRSCIRYSRVPVALQDAVTTQNKARTVFPPGWRRQPVLFTPPVLLTLSHVTTDIPVFSPAPYCSTAVPSVQVDPQGVFSDVGSGVLHTATPDSIRLGAEDGGEMGAYSIFEYCQSQNAILDKMKDYLPIGMQAVIVPDPRLDVNLPIFALDTQSTL